MDLDHRSFAGFDFWKAGTLEIQRNADGSLHEYRHSFDGEVRLNRHAEGPFCRMGLPRAPRASGVYVISIGGDVRYVGRCVDLAQRFGPMGYGEIHPRNCHDDGQSTNCKLNARVLEAARLGLSTTVWFHPTADHQEVERLLIQLLSPPWNGSEPGSNRERRGNGTVPNSNGTAPTALRFRSGLEAMLREAEASGAASVVMRAGDLHRMVGGYPGADHRMPMCCAAMRAAMEAGDRYVHQPPKGNGASLSIEYRLPRSRRSAAVG